MIYLILSAEIEIIDKERGEFKYSPLLKIGYTKDIDSRFDSYLLHNPGCKLLGTREGDTNLESFLHSYFQKYSYPGRDREWFYYNQEIVDNFQSLQIGDKFLSKEEYIEGLREYIKSNISTPQELKEKYLEDILVKIENTESDIEFDREFHRSYTMRIWEERYEEEMKFLDSFDFLDLIKDFPENINLRENPWKNSATFYYRTTADYRKMDGEDFRKIIENKKSMTENLLLSYRTSPTESSKYALASTYQDLARLKNYKDDYIAVNKIVNDTTGDIILKPVLNELVLVNELRAFKIQQIDYKDRFTVFTTIHTQMSPDDIINQEVSRFMEMYFSKTTKYEKLRLLCESKVSQGVMDIVLNQISDSDEVKSYYLTLGPQRLYSLGYNVTKIKKELGIVVFSDELLYDSIYSTFKEGDKLLLPSIKEKLGVIYSSLSYSKTPKAIDLQKWFDIKESTMRTIIDGEKKTVRYYELLKSKEQELRLELKHRIKTCTMIEKFI